MFRTILIGVERDATGALTLFGRLALPKVADLWLNEARLEGSTRAVYQVREDWRPTIRQRRIAGINIPLPDMAPTRREAAIQAWVLESFCRDRVYRPPITPAPRLRPAALA